MELSWCKATALEDLSRSTLRAMSRGQLRAGGLSSGQAQLLWQRLQTTQPAASDAFLTGEEVQPAWSTPDLLRKISSEFELRSLFTAAGTCKLWRRELLAGPTTVIIHASPRSLRPYFNPDHERSAHRANGCPNAVCSFPQSAETDQNTVSGMSTPHLELIWELGSLVYLPRLHSLRLCEVIATREVLQSVLLVLPRLGGLCELHVNNNWTEWSVCEVATHSVLVEWKAVAAQLTQARTLSGNLGLSGSEHLVCQVADEMRSVAELDCSLFKCVEPMSIQALIHLQLESLELLWLRPGNLHFLDSRQLRLRNLSVVCIASQLQLLVGFVLSTHTLLDITIGIAEFWSKHELYTKQEQYCAKLSEDLAPLAGSHVQTLRVYYSGMMESEFDDGELLLVNQLRALLGPSISVDSAMREFDKEEKMRRDFANYYNELARP